MMKKIMIALAISAATFFCISGLAKADLDDGLVAYYPFNGNVNDESGNGHHGSLIGTTILPTKDKLGNINSAYRFQGDPNDFIRLPEEVLNGLNDFTVSVWAKADDLSHERNGNFILSGAYSDNDNEFYMAIRDDEQLSWHYSCNASRREGTLGNAIVSASQWYHMVITRDGFTRRMYLDGVLDYEGTHGAESLIIDDVVVGQDQDCVGDCFESPQSWHGIIDNIRIYNRALSEAEIFELYIGNYDFGVISGTVSREDTGLPISNAKVSAGGQSEITDQDGDYVLSGLPQGTYDVQASHPDYQQKGIPTVTVIANATTALSFTMEPKNKTCGTPVILVRGMGKDIDWDETEQETHVEKSQHLYWKEMREELRNQGFTVWECNEPDPVVWNPDHSEGRWINGEQSVEKNGKWLYEYIKKKTEHECGTENFPEKINIIAHSMGGLITRHFLELNQNKNIVDVGNVIMLSTPNAGSIMADLGVAAGVLDLAGIDKWYGKWLENQWKSLPSRLTTSTAYVRHVFNPTHKWNSEDALYLLAGGFYGWPFDAPPFNPDYPKVAIGVDLLKGLSPKWDKKNDSLVTVQSGYGRCVLITPVPLIPIYFQSFINADQAKERSEAHLDHYRIRSDPSVLNWVVAILNDYHQLYSTFTSQSVMALSDELNNDELQLPSQQLEGERQELVVPGHFEHTIPNDSPEVVTFYVYSSGGNLSFTLRNPSGGIIDPASAGSDPNVHYEEIPGSEPESGLQFYQIQLPEKGNWSVLYDTTTAPVTADLAVFGNTNLTLVPTTDYYVDFGSMPIISCTLFDIISDTSTPVLGATVNATITRPDETTETLSLYDDGLNLDGAANDGIYATVISPINQEGGYLVDYRADGVGPAGDAFRRVASSEFAAGAIRDRIVGNLTDQGVDTDFDGIWDLLRLQCVVTVEEAGTYSISGTMVNQSTGGRVSGSELLEHMPEGPSTVSLYFILKGLDAQSQCGDFILKDLRLFKQHDGRLHWADTYNGEYTTKGRVKSNFDCDCDVDGSDLAVFAADFGRTDCAVEDPCEGDFDGDGAVDESDLPSFAIDFGMKDCPILE